MVYHIYKHDRRVQNHNGCRWSLSSESAASEDSRLAETTSEEPEDELSITRALLGQTGAGLSILLPTVVSYMLLGIPQSRSIFLYYNS